MSLILLRHKLKLKCLRHPSAQSPSLRPKGIISKTVSSNESAVAQIPLPTVVPSTSTPDSVRIPPRLAQPIPGLRIIKRSKTIGHAKTDSSSVSSCEETATQPVFTYAPITNDKSRAAVLPILADGAPSVTRQTHNVSSASTAQTVRAARVVTQPSIPAVQPTSHSNHFGTGPRRVLVSEEPKSVPAATGWRSKIGGALERGLNTASAGPRRIVIPTPAIPSASVKPAVHAKMPTPAITGLKQPTKYVVSTTASGLPKPVARSTTSRLPAPSSTGVRKAGVTEGGTAKSTLNQRF